MKQEVVVTGMGVISPLGNTIHDFSKNLFLGKSGIRKISRFNPAELPTKIAGEVQGIESNFRDIKIAFALQAAKDAMNDAFPNGIEELKNKQTVCSLGIGLELFSMSDLIELKINKQNNPNIINQLTFLNTPSDICAHLISKEFKLNNGPLLHISACAAGTDAIGNGYQKIQSGEMDLVIAGGADSMINPMGVAGFCRIGAMSIKNETPELASNPFDKKRDGFVMGEGAAFIILEEKKSAINRGAKIYGKISGYGNSLDAYSVSDPHPEGDGALKSMSRALKDANIKTTELSAINAHGTGTPKNDPAESKAIQRLLGKYCDNVPVFTTKSMIGHLISAAGAVETVASLICIREQKLHITKNLTEVDDKCQLNHVVNSAKSCDINHILKNSFGFGGQNATIIISKD